MATEAQIAANRRNAQSSTGPCTAEGKSRTSRNAVTSGLFSAGDFVRPDETETYRLFCDSYERSLRPKGALESTLAAEIIHAAWRLRRCSVVESEITADPAETLTISLNRARAEAQRHLLRAVAELRRLQTDRQFRAEHLDPDCDTNRIGGLAGMKEVIASRRLRATTKQTQSAAEPAASAPIQVPRSAPCPCGSGHKFKRCCGQGAAPILSRAA